MKHIVDDKSYAELYRHSWEDGKYTAIRLDAGGGTLWLRHGEPWEAATRDWRFAKAINGLLDELHDRITSSITPHDSMREALVKVRAFIYGPILNAAGRHGDARDIQKVNTIIADIDAALSDAPLQKVE